MPSISLFLSLLTSLLFSCSMAITSPHNRTSYIRTSCSHTLYPALCYSSLSPYAHRVGTNPVLLSRFAMNVTLVRLKPLSLRQRAALPPSYSYYSGNGSGSGSSTPTVLKDDCGDFISHATDLVRNSEKEVTGLEEKVGPEVVWRISNAQTWLSAALTYEETCTDEIEEGSGGTNTGKGKGEDVEQLCKKLKRVKQLTSNALALVNCLVN